MKYKQKKAILLLLSLSLAGWALGFYLGFEQDSQRVRVESSLIKQHLEYALRSKDDMAVIDLANALEKLDGLLAFRFMKGSIVVVDGGNRDYLPIQKNHGLCFHFPSIWSLIEDSNPNNTYELILIWQIWPGPILWGMLLGIGVIFTATITSYSVRKSHEQLHPLEPSARADSLTENAHHNEDGLLHGFEGQAVLLLDGYNIRWASPQAVDLLSKDGEKFYATHLLELFPEKHLMEALDKKEKAFLSTAFKDHPEIQATLKPDRAGLILLLERVKG
jgi:hypothetical protein